MVNTTFDTSEGAETNCKANGGHLVAYTSEQEQVGCGQKQLLGTMRDAASTSSCALASADTCLFCCSTRWRPITSPRA